MPRSLAGSKIVKVPTRIFWSKESTYLLFIYFKLITYVSRLTIKILIKNKNKFKKVVVIFSKLLAVNDFSFIIKD